LNNTLVYTKMVTSLCKVRDVKVLIYSLFHLAKVIGCTFAFRQT